MVTIRRLYEPTIITVSITSSFTLLLWLCVQVLYLYVKTSILSEIDKRLSYLFLIVCIICI